MADEGDRGFGTSVHELHSEGVFKDVGDAFCIAGALHSVHSWLLTCRAGGFGLFTGVPC